MEKVLGKEGFSTKNILIGELSFRSGKKFKKTY